MHALLPSPTIAALAVLVMAASAACGGRQVSEPVVETVPIVAPARDAVSAPELAGLAEGIDARGLSEGAVIQMLAFREQVYLPFRYRQGVAIDGRGWVPSRDLAGIRAGFARLGEDGRAVLQRCVREAAEDRVGSVHLAGDDTAFMGRACLEMLAVTYGEDALPFLVAFAREPFRSPNAMLLQRATLDLLETLAPGAELPGGAREAGWRQELLAWSAWLKRQGPRNVDDTLREVCDADCEAELLSDWIGRAAGHLVMPGIDAPEPRYVSTLRAFVSVRAERWLPWIADASKDALARRETVSALRTGLLVGLWAEAASDRYPRYFRQIVLPTLVGAIRPSDAGQPYARPVTHSELVIEALNRATGVHFQSAACEATPTETSVRHCLIDQARSWRGYLLAHAWLI